jgi:methyl-accepting chemotaxis protein
MSLRNLNIAPRSALGFGLIGLIVLLLGVFSLSQMSAMRKEAKEVDQNWLPSIIALSELNQSILRVRVLTYRLAVVTESSLLQETQAKLTQLLDDVRTLDNTFAKYLTTAEERTAYQRFKAEQAQYLQYQSEIARLVSQGQREQAMTVLNGNINMHADGMTKALVELMGINRDEAGGAAQRAESAYDEAFNWVIITIIAAGLLTALLATLFTRSIVSPLELAVRAAEYVAAGDLTKPIDIEGRDEPARLLQALKRMQGSLRDTIQRIADSSNQLASAAEELNAVTEDSTRGLHAQNNEIEQAATAVNEMTVAVEEVAQNAVSTSQASGESDKTARLGRQQVLQTVDSISQLAGDVTHTASQVEQLAGKVRGISQVLDVIRSIAEQTNLLALNAAIEAARAGDAGRGFAVVADEVRALAHRTQQSTQEIEQMIGGIQQGTDQAVDAMQQSNQRARSTLEVAQSAGEALDRITSSITQINERNLVIASAAEEQAQVAREVDRNLVNIRDLALQTSAGANQTSAASQELSRLAVDLNGMVARFTV